ncbi:unnamed protein product [Lactuca saligna]|uniref:DUF7054 domain-containing protein n=1 Tax=Lactuca saligna TaxID=75948 RepID=A0AA35YYL5_LACSI|nr:unnamed protein product [Lactuca saligna]
METDFNMKKIILKRKISPKKTKNITVDNRLLITVNVVGSSGPLRLVVNKNDKVSTVIDSSLKLYARGGRLPVLGSDFKNFMLYALIEGSALDPSQEIGSYKGRNFALCKKKNKQVNEARSLMINRKHSGRWKGWLLCLAQ